MSKQNKPINLFKIVTTVVFFIVLPIFLIYSAIEVNFAILAASNKVKKERALEKIVSRVEILKDDRKFFHVFLQNKFREADQKNSPAQLHQKLKAIFKNKIKLIFWDNRGKVDSRFSDEKKFSYILKKMWKAIGMLSEHCRKNQIPAPQRISFLSENMTLLRRYFGSFLVPDVMARPLLKGVRGDALYVSNDKDKGFLWYQFGKNFSTACLISMDLKHKNLGLVNLCHANNQGSELKIGFVSTVRREIHAPWANSEENLELQIEIEKFHADASSFHQSKNFHLYFRQVSPRILLFSALRKSSADSDSRKHINRWAFKIFKFMLIAGFIIYCASLRNQLQLSVKTRLIGILVFSMGLPLLIMIASCFEYFHFQKTSLIFRRHSESLTMLRGFDERYPIFQNRLAKILNNHVSELQARYGLKKWPDVALESLEAKANSFSPTEMGLVKSGSGLYFHGGKYDDKDSRENLSSVFSGILEALNSTKTAKSKYIEKTMSGFANESSLIVNILQDTKKISTRTLSSGHRKVYMNFLGDRENHQCWGMLAILWDFESLQRYFFKSELKKFNDEMQPGRISIMENATEEIFPESKIASEKMLNIFKRAITSKFVFEDSLTIANEEFIVTAMSGTQLSKGTLLMLYPKKLLFSEIENLKNKVVGGSALVVLFIVLLATRFSALFFAPLSDLEKGLKSIQQRNFRYRINSNAKNEFGELIEAFNIALESMGDLSLGTSVQESLLPLRNHTASFYEILASSIFMTSMGGDFFDYSEIDKEVVSITFGDVAGHGVPAALVMAMIKAHTSLPDNSISPGEFLANCNEILRYLRKKKWKRMMTLQNLQINFRTGKTKFANAGHCFPIHVSRDTGKAEFIAAEGFPLGGRNLKVYREVQMDLCAGDLLILYSDGFIEASKADGEQFGYERFLQLIEKNFLKNNEELYSSLINEHKIWAPIQDDDLSLLIFRLKHGN